MRQGTNHQTNRKGEFNTWCLWVGGKKMWFQVCFNYRPTIWDSSFYKLYIILPRNTYNKRIVRCWRSVHICWTPPNFILQWDLDLSVAVLIDVTSPLGFHSLFCKQDDRKKTPCRVSFLFGWSQFLNTEQVGSEASSSGLFIWKPPKKETPPGGEGFFRSECCFADGRWSILRNFDLRSQKIISSLRTLWGWRTLDLPRHGAARVPNLVVNNVSCWVRSKRKRWALVQPATVK